MSCNFFNWNVWIISYTGEGKMGSNLHLPPYCSPERNSSGNLGLSAAASPLQLQMFSSFPLVACCREEKGKKLLLGTPLHGSQMSCGWGYSCTSKTMSHYYKINCSTRKPQPIQSPGLRGCSNMCQLAAGLRGLCTIQVRTHEVQQAPIIFSLCPSVSPLT